jgi:glutathione S-transferase
MPILWGRSNSSNVMKVMWLCAELGLGPERREAGGAFGLTQDPAFRAMNPNGLVPVWQEEDGWALWESNAILRHLAATRPGGAALYPAEARARAGTERWMDWQLAHLAAPMTTVFFTHVRTPEAERDGPATEAARLRAAVLWQMVERQLEGRDFLEGGFGLADIALGVFAHRWFALPIERPALPGLRAWYERLRERPGYAPVLAPMT